MITVAPSILACDFLNIETELSYIKGAKDLWYHLDIMDGHFVPNLTFGNPVIQKIAGKTTHPLDVHLMVTNPKFYFETLKDIDIYNINFHLETVTEKEALDLIHYGKKYYKSVGITLKPNTPFGSIPHSVFKEIDMVLIMSVEPGFGGQKFIESTYEKLDEVVALKDTLNENLVVQVDGGINGDNAHKLIRHGANNLVAGTYIFQNEQKEYLNIIETLRPS